MLLRQKIVLIIIANFISIISWTQIELNHSIQFTSDTNEFRQIENLSSPNTLTDALQIEAFVSGAINYYQFDTIINDTLYLKNNLQISTLLEGMKINFLLPVITSNQIYLSINSISPVLLMSNYFDSLIINSIPSGSVLSVIFDGNVFQILTPINKICPDGFTEVNIHYCIQNSESTISLDFYDAATTCQNNGYRMCSWGEWYYACQKSGLGLSNMTNNYEWVNENCNTAGNALIIGSGTCQTSTPIVASGNLRRFRCCYSK